jgi:PAS domain S-box-containing protein
MISSLHLTEIQGRVGSTNMPVGQSEVDFQDLIASTGGRVWEVDERLRYVYASPNQTGLLGYTPKELLGRTPFDFMPLDEAVRMRGVFEGLILGQCPFLRTENLSFHKDGSLRTLETSGIPLFDALGRFTGLRGIDHDVTERKNQEQALQAALVRSAREQARSAAIIAAIGEGLIIIDPDFRVLYQNQILKDLGLDPAQDHCYVVYGKRDNVCDVCPVVQTFEDGGIHSVEKSAVKDGATVFREITSSPLLDESGTIIAGIELVRDITERKRAEHALIESEWQMKEVQRIANLGSWQLDYGTGKLVWSEETYRILGLSAQEIPASYEAFLDVVHPEDRELVVRLFRESLRNGSIGFENEYRIVRQPGSVIRHIHQKCEHIKGDAGRVIRSFGMVHDITTRKEAEERISTLNTALSARAAELEIANKDLEAFSYTVSHDLRGPLTNINSYCQAIAELDGDKLDSQCAGFMESVFQEVKSMDGLITSLLNLSRFTHIQLKRKRMDLSEMARTIAAELQIREPERRVRFEIGEGIAASGDERLLRMVLVNLLSNSWKFTGEAADPVIRFGVTRVQGRSIYCVSDNGIGFEMSQSSKIFDVFQRLNRSEKFEGFGIGLTTVQRIVQRHNGRVWAEGEPGKGARFFFTLHDRNVERRT